MTERAKKLLLLYYKQSRKIRRVSGLPPLTFKAKKAGTLNNYRIYGNTETKTRSYSGSAPLSFPIEDGSVSNYRIYGNTVNGESVGDRTENLFDENQQMTAGVINSDGTINTSITYAECSDYIPIDADGSYTVRVTYHGVNNIRLAIYNSSKQFIERKSIGGTEPSITFNRKNFSDASFIRLCLDKDWLNCMINFGSTALPYEPYGYKIPTTNNSETSNIYLDEPLAKSGNNADYIDYATQKRHNSDGTESSVTLPEIAVTAGTNTLTVGTEVQPSSVAVDVDEIVSCGDKTGNLFDGNVEYGSFDGSTGEPVSSMNRVRSTVINLRPGTYTISLNGVSSLIMIVYDMDEYKKEESVISYKSLPYTFTLNDTRNIRFAFRKSDDSRIVIDDISNIQIEIGSIATDYEPYGYRIPITNNSETSNIYLDEPLAKSGNNADYIDYMAQKRHNSDGMESSITLPAISTLAGTNTLTVGTEVQPSSVEIKGRIKAAGGD